MAEPVTRKIDTLPNAITVANNDELIVMDVSESAVNMTKKMTMSQIPISLASQLGTDVVENAKIKDGAVTASKIANTTITGGKLVNKTITAAQIADTTITGGKLVNGTITATQMAAGAAVANIATGGIATAKLADEAVTEAKLGAIVRTVIVPVYGDLDSIVVANFPRRFPWVHALDGHVITRATVVLHGAVSSSGSVTVVITNAGGTAATISVAQGLSSATTTTIATAYKTAAALAPVGINITAAGTGAKGLSVYLEMLG